MTHSSTGTTRNPALPKPGCVLKVGEGRGFVFEYPYEVPQSVLREARKRKLRLRPRRWRRVIVTAAHCLGKLPPAHAMSYAEEKTYNLLGSLDGGRSNVCAECLFVDPVADIAVLGAPDGQLSQEMYEQSEAYDALVDDAPALRIGKPRTGRGWMLGLDGHWFPTSVKVYSSLFGTALSTGSTKGGMSGSPILNDAGRAVGVVVVGTETTGGRANTEDEWNGPQPILIRDLPGRFVG